MFTIAREYTTITERDLINYIDYYYSLDMISHASVDGSIIVAKSDDITIIDHIHLINTRAKSFIKSFSNDDIIIHGTLEIVKKDYKINILCDGNLDYEGRGYIRSIKCTDAKL